MRMAMHDYDQIVSCLARMRGPMLKDKPGYGSGSISDVLECALQLEKFQGELFEELKWRRGLMAVKQTSEERAE